MKGKDTTPKGSGRTLKVRVKTARGRSVGQVRWLERQLNDPYVQAAKNEGYRSRAAFKLMEIDDQNRLIRKGGTIVDGTGSPRFVGDIGIKDGIITDIGAGISGDASDVIDGTGKIVAPGVIDAHTHYDAQLHWDPYATNSGWHGTTTIGVGNCGFGFAPCHPQDRERYMQMMETTEQVPVNAMRTALGWDWVSFPEWIEHLKQAGKPLPEPTAGKNVAEKIA